MIDVRPDLVGLLAADHHDMAVGRHPEGAAAGWVARSLMSGQPASQQVGIPKGLLRACYSLFLPIAIPPYCPERAYIVPEWSGCIPACKNDD